MTPNITIFDNGVSTNVLTAQLTVITNLVPFAFEGVAQKTSDPLLLTLVSFTVFLSAVCVALLIVPFYSKKIRQKVAKALKLVLLGIVYGFIMYVLIASTIGGFLYFWRNVQ